MLLGGLAVGSADCMEERAPISRVQTLYVDKHFFVGQSLQDSSDNPEFYVNNFVVDAPASQNLLPVGTYDDVERIRWEIQENLLIARKSYEYVTGSDGRGASAATNNGLIVAAYRIESHFDIRNAYNPTTGEPSNVVEENQSDRPWYLRENMRVDWSENLVLNPDWSWMFYGSIFGSISFEPVRYTEVDPRSPRFPNVCEMQEGMVRNPNYDPANASSGDLCIRATNPRNHPGGYFDITSRWLVNPEMSDEFGFAFPTCAIVNFFTGSETYDCNPQEATIRTSFRRVVDRDFQPLELTQQPYDIVGGPRATRNGFDQGYGATDRNFHRYQMVHNIWQQSHLRVGTGAAAHTVACEGRDLNNNGQPDGNEDANSDGTADACANVAGLDAAAWAGSQCDPVVGACTIPYRNRDIRPIAYYINPEMPAEFQDHVETENSSTRALAYRLPTAQEVTAHTFTVGPTEQIANTWDIAVRRGVAAAREVECRKLGTDSPFGGTRDACHAKYFATGDNAMVPMEDGAFLSQNPRADLGEHNVPHAVVLCHNPVRSDDSSACREVGYSVRLGDVRYNHITYWAGNSRAPFGGIAHWGYDPLTGEVVSNGAFNMGRSVEYAAAQQRDYIRMILHAIDPNLDDLSVEDYTSASPAQRLEEYIRNPGTTHVGATGDRLTAAQIDAHMNNLVPGVERNAPIAPATANDVQAAILAQDRQDRQAASTPSQGLSNTAVAFDRAANAIRGTVLETQMVDQGWLRAAGVDPTRALSSQSLDAASPLRRMDPQFQTEVRERLMARLEARGFCFQDAGAPPLVGSMDMQGVARWFAARYGDMSKENRAARILQDLRPDAYKGIALHEVGHSIGLYHLPVSSYDSANYNPQYWQLRTRNGMAAGSCRPANCGADNMAACASIRSTDRNNDNCMGPRWIDPETDEELGVRPLAMGNHHAGLQYFGNTSTMEYQWERFGETVGLGSYDLYAMGVLYGRVMETVDDDTTHEGGMAPQDQRRFSFNLRSQLQNRDLAYVWDPFLSTAAQRMGPAPLQGIHYTELARQLHVFDPSRCRAATDAEKERYKWRLVNGQICSHIPRDFHALSDMETSNAYYAAPPASQDPDSNAPMWRVRDGVRDGDHVITGGNGPLRQRYRVSWDRGTGYPHINYFDQGADLYEVTESITRKYDLLYPASYFRRGNREWQSWNVTGGVATRMFKMIHRYHWSVARDTAFYRERLNDASYQQYLRSDNQFGSHAAIQPRMFDFFARVMLTPEPGQYGISDGSDNSDDHSTPELRSTRTTLWDANEFSTAPRFSIGLVNGRFIGDEFDNAQGGSLDYQSYQRHEGAYMEKAYAAIMLTDTRPAFSSITRGLYLDGREFQVNFATDIPGALDRLLGGILSEDWQTVSMHAMAPAAGAESLEVSPSMLPLWDSTSMLTRPANAMVMFPNIGYREQVPTLIYSMLFSSLNSDLTLINKLRVYTEGGVEAVDIPEAQRVRFLNPETGIIYVGRRYGADPNLTTIAGGRTVDRGIASRMMQHADTMAREIWATDAAMPNNPDGTPNFRRDASGNLVVNPAVASSPQIQARRITQFRNYVGLIDAARYVARLLGYGTLH